MANKSKCIFPKMGTKKFVRYKKENQLTPRERTAERQKKLKEFRKWFE